MRSGRGGRRALRLQQLTRFAPDLVPELIDAFLTRGPGIAVSGEVMLTILRSTAGRYEAKVLAAFDEEPTTWPKFFRARLCSPLIR